MNFETIIRNLQEDIETLQNEYATIIHDGFHFPNLENDLLQQIDELQDTLNELTT